MFSRHFRSSSADTRLSSISSACSNASTKTNTQPRKHSVAPSSMRRCTLKVTPNDRQLNTNRVPETNNNSANKTQNAVCSPTAQITIHKEETCLSGGPCANVASSKNIAGKRDLRYALRRKTICTTADSHNHQHPFAPWAARMMSGGAPKKHNERHRNSEGDPSHNALPIASLCLQTIPANFCSTKYFQMRLPTEKFVTAAGSDNKSSANGDVAAGMDTREYVGKGMEVAEPTAAASMQEKCVACVRQLGIHGLLAVCVICYILAGAVIFQQLETQGENRAGVKELLDQIRTSLPENVSENVEHSLRDILRTIRRESGVEVVVELIRGDNDTMEEDKGMYSWESFPASVLFAFTAVSTVGYGHIYPVTQYGRLFCILYTICGIPLFMIGVADVGKFVWEMFRYTLRGKLRSDSVGELSLAVSVPLIVSVFIMYIFFGAIVIPLWEPRLGFVQAIYFCFISVTTVGFGDIIPENRTFLAVTLIYVFFGLALTTLAIEVLAAALRRFHYLGKPIQNARRATVWIGGKLMNVDLLMRSMAREFGATESEVAKLGDKLDHVLEYARAEVAATGNLAMHEPIIAELAPKRSGERYMNGDIHRKYSGSYDNIPESWTKVHRYMDDGEAYYLLNVPLDNI